MVSAGLWRAQVDAFMDELGRVDTHGTLCTTPLLLNLMLSEYLRHEAKDSAIRFDGAPHLMHRPTAVPLLLPRGDCAPLTTQGQT